MQIIAKRDQWCDGVFVPKGSVFEGHQCGGGLSLFYYVSEKEALRNGAISSKKFGGLYLTLFANEIVVDINTIGD